jgi:hypothetical protein
VTSPLSTFDIAADVIDVASGRAVVRTSDQDLEVGVFLLDP